MTRLAVSLRGLNPKVQLMPVQQAVVCAWVVDAHREGRLALMLELVENVGIHRETLDRVVQDLERRGFLEKRAKSTGKPGTAPHVLRATPKLLRWFGGV